MQQPSIGRIVHYVSGDAHHAAIITRVNGDGTVDLTIFQPMLERYDVFVAYSSEPVSGSWHWPEYVPPTED